MEFLFDSANLEAIQTYSACFPITGVTSNPSILKAEGKIDPVSYTHLDVYKRQALEGTKSQMMDMVAAGWHEIGSDDGAIEIDDDLEYFKDGIYLSIYDAGGVPLYGAVPRDFDNSAVFAPNDLRTIPSGGKSWYVYDEQKQVYGYGTVWIRSVAEADQIDSTISTLFRFALIILPFLDVYKRQEHADVHDRRIHWRPYLHLCCGL